jgi:Ca2+-binding EF-hand superfamily protein
MRPDVGHACASAAEKSVRLLISRRVQSIARAFIAACDRNEKHKENSMHWKTTTTMAVLSAALLLGTGPLTTTAVAAPNTLKAIDTDNDATVDVNEAKAAASALFDRLDTDHEGTIDRKELRGRVSAKELGQADPDHDGTLTKDEYLALVETRFKAADHDNDGTLDAKELKSVTRLLK